MSVDDLLISYRRKEKLDMEVINVFIMSLLAAFPQHLYPNKYFKNLILFLYGG